MLISDFACKGMTKCEDEKMEWKLKNLHGHVKMMYVFILAISSNLYKHCIICKINAELISPFIWLMCCSNSCIMFTFIGMSQKMSPQTSSLPEWFVAISARMRFLSSVCHHVFPQITSLIERFVAAVTLVRLLSSVDEKVPLQISSYTEWLVAPFTDVHFLSKLVPLQSFSSPK